MNRLRGLALLALALPVLTGLMSTIVVKVAEEQGSGIPFERSDAVTFLVAFVGAAVLGGLTARAALRAEQATSFRAYAAIVGGLGLLGLAAGAFFGHRVAGDRIQYLTGEADRVCAELSAVHPAPADCRPRALACRAEVLAAPPAISRGLGAAIPAGEPVDPVERAIWDCVRR